MSCFQAANVQLRQRAEDLAGQVAAARAEAAAAGDLAGILAQAPGDARAVAAAAAALERAAQESRNAGVLALLHQKVRSHAISNTVCLLSGSGRVSDAP